MSVNVSFWLVPSASDRAILQALIHQLAVQHQAPSFTPHVTLYAGEYAQESAALDLMQQTTAGIQAFSLNVNGIATSDEFTKTLFLQIGACPMLHQLSMALRRGSIQPSPYIFEPHMSLLYHQMNARQRKELEHAIQVPLPTIKFDTITAVVYHPPIRTKFDVESWQEIGARCLIPFAADFPTSSA